MSSAGPSAHSPVSLAQEPRFAIGGLTVSPSTREVIQGNRREVIEPRVMQVLVALSRAKGEVVSRDDLVDLCWEGRIVGDDAINRSISKARRIGETSGAFAVETIARVGYRLLPQGATPDPSARPKSARPKIGPARAAKLAALAIGVVAILALVAAMVWPPPLRVAVANFESSPLDARGSALAGRVHDQIASLLTAQRIDVGPQPARFVISGASDTGEGLAHVRIRIEHRPSRLILWQHEFTGSAAADTPLPEQIAARVTGLMVDAFNLAALGHDRVDGATLKAYLIGVDGAADGKPFDEVTYFRALHKTSPNLAMANAQLAQVLFSNADDQPPDVAAKWRAEANALAHRALTLDQMTPSTYWVLANAQPGGAFATRQAFLAEGLKHAPAYPSLNVAQGLLLSEIGRPREGLSYVRRGQTADPLSPMKNFGNASYYAAVGLIDEARQQLRNSRRIWPDNPNVGPFFTLFAVDFAEPDEGASIIEDLYAKDPRLAPQIALWRAYFRSLKCRCETHAAGERILAAFRAGDVDKALAFPALSRLGEVDMAFEAAGRPGPGNRFYYRRFLFMPQTAPMRQQARFIDLAGDLGLVDYWRSSGKWPEFCSEPGLAYDCKVEAARVAARKPAAGEPDRSTDPPPRPVAPSSVSV